jgi:3-oxoacyl-[acyl-carrier-protein] synthase-3
MATVSRIAGTGSYLPARIVSNEEISTWVETSDEWIRERSGITQRHFAGDGEFTSDLAEKASRAALEAAGIDGSELDLIVLATATPDHTFPATATKLQARLGMTGGFAFDVQAVCCACWGSRCSRMLSPISRKSPMMRSAGQI